MLLKRVSEVVTEVVLGLPPSLPFGHLLDRAHPFVVQDLHSRWICQAIKLGAENEAKKVHELKPRLPVRASLDTRDILYTLACLYEASLSRTFVSASTGRQCGEYR
jgi:hypothetical protein